MADVNEQDFVDLDIEAESDDEPLVEYDLSVSPSDPSLELLAEQVKRKDIIIPFYQRKFVWKIEQASRLIESFLMGLPVPQVFFYVNAENQLEVIDGQQRIMSVKYFFEGYFGEPDSNGYRQVFRLKGLAERSEYNGKKFDELSNRDQRKLRNSTLRAINIRQLKPTLVQDSVFHIFQRLNTGGTQLKPQEIRNAVYRGNIVTELRDLNLNKDWQALIGVSKPDKNQKDVELILRLFALSWNWRNYEKPMLTFLNREMDKNREFSSERARGFKAEFARVVASLRGRIDKPFRPKGVINSAVLEAVIVTLIENPAVDMDRIADRYMALLVEPAFTVTIAGSTADTRVLRRRLEIAKEKLVDEEI